MHRNSLTIAGLLIVPMLAGLAFADTIPRRVLIADVDHTSVQISPDGMRVGWIFTDTAGRHLFVRELAGSSEREVAPGTEITAWQWSKGSDKLLIVTHGAAGETLSALPLDNPPKTQTLISGSRVRVIGANATDVVASVVTSSADSTGVFRIHLDGSGAEKLADIGDADAWWVDRDMRLIAARIQNENGFALAYRRADKAWVAFTQAGPVDGLPVSVVSASPDGSKLYATVGSNSNVAERGMGIEEGRAAIWEVDPKTGQKRLYATGLRNPNGMAWESGVLWTVVNERDGLGDETPPDYLTSVRDGGFYGWPYCYWGQTVDDRVPQDPAMVAKAIQPDYALGGHTASLGLCWMPSGTLPGFPDGMVIGQHGSWNRSTLSGYAVVFVPFENGRPSGPPRDILTGFLAPDEKVSYRRPVGVTLGPDGSLLVADDVGNVIWRVTGA